MTTNSSKVIKSFSCRLKSTEGEETLKTEVKLKHLKKNPSQKTPNCSNIPGRLPENSRR